MTRVFAYCRVSTREQTTDNQIREIEGAGFALDARRMVAECISGSMSAGERPGFAKLLERLEDGDVLVVTKLDRLGRNAMDVRTTVERLAGLGVRVHCLALGGTDLTSAAGKMTMGVIAAVAEFERDLLVERTQAGLARAKGEGRTLGRKPVLSPEKQREAYRRIVAGESIAQIARDYGTTRQPSCGSGMRERGESRRQNAFSWERLWSGLRGVCIWLRPSAPASLAIRVSTAMPF